MSARITKRTRRGQGLVEYIIIVASVALIALVSVSIFKIERYFVLSVVLKFSPHLHFSGFIFSSILIFLLLLKGT